MQLDINPLNTPETEFAEYSVRETSRAIIFDAEDKIALISMPKEGKHKLPGGGIEHGETAEEAVVRECREEIGVGIQSLRPLGTVREIQSANQRIQISHCFVGRVVGEKGLPEPTSDELSRGFQVEWLPLQQAISLITVEGYESEMGRFVFERELGILKAARKAYE